MKAQILPLGNSIERRCLYLLCDRIHLFKHVYNNIFQHKTEGLLDRQNSQIQRPASYINANCKPLLFVDGSYTLSLLLLAALLKVANNACRKFADKRRRSFWEAVLPQQYLVFSVLIILGALVLYIHLQVCPYLHASRENCFWLSIDRH